MQSDLRIYAKYAEFVPYTDTLLGLIIDGLTDHIFSPETLRLITDMALLSVRDEFETLSICELPSFQYKVPGKELISLATLTSFGTWNDTTYNFYKHLGNSLDLSTSSNWGMSTARKADLSLEVYDR
eukprot:UN05318